MLVKTIIILSLVMALAGGACACVLKAPAAEAKQRSPLHEAAGKALARAADAITQQERMDAGTIWNLQQVLGLRPDERLGVFVDAHVVQLKGTDYERLVNPGAPRAKLPEDPGTGAMLLANSLKAAVGEPESRAVEWLTDFVERPSFGYVLTHQLLAIKWAEWCGLALPQSLLDQRSLLLERIEQEQAEATVYSDIYAERVALLLMYWQPDAADTDRWVETIIGEQLENGMWDSRPAAAGAEGNRHPTTWCMLALAAFLESY
jgi:hypothetical protein